MYFKRFAQLFAIFFIVSAILVAIFATNFTGNTFLTFFVALIIAYVILTLPLVLLTLRKSQHKEQIAGTQAKTGLLADYLKKLPGFIALAVSDENGLSSTTIMTFTQSIQQENVLYMVTEKTASKARALALNPDVSFTTWYDSFENCGRLSSNQVRVKLFNKPTDNKALIASEPNILKLHENAANMTIIQLSLRSALYEDLKGAKVLDFTKSSRQVS